MKVRSAIIGIIAAGLSLFIFVGCDDSSSDNQIVDTTEIGPLSGPGMYQTGYTVVQGTQDNVASGNTDVPNFTYTTDTATNITGNGMVSFGTPDVVYDESGRAIEIHRFSSIYTVSYNNDDSIASIARTDVIGDLRKVVFNYEAGRLVSKSSTKEDTDGTVSDIGSINYAYAANGHLISANSTCEFEALNESIDETYKFETDASGRVIRSGRYEENRLVDDYVFTYDANGNIVESNLYGGPADDNALFVKITYTYTASVEPTVNLIGFMAATNDGFIPEFNLCPGF